jgi:hypothetical protein
MNVDSSTVGFLSPAESPAPREDTELDGLFQVLIVGLTGLAGQNVRPRWQPGNPKQPEASTDWCAIGISVMTADAGPAIQHLGTGEGADLYVRHEAIEVLATFYGPHGQSLATRTRDGIAIPQNVEYLLHGVVGFVECGEIRQVPELVNQQWIRRHDMAMRFRRKVSRVYAIRNVRLADIRLIDDTHVDEIVTVPPAP